MAKIYNLTLGYRLARRYIHFTYRQFYTKLTVLGKENIPHNGPVIIAPNHQNALMDALLVLQATPWKLTTVFVARGDIFKKGFVINALRFMKILPAFRMRDGYENLGKNDATFEEAREVLETGNSLCIFPEGNQADKMKLQPLVKGIFRIAFSAQERIGEAKDIKILPVGIDYTDRQHFGEDVLINYGELISVSEFLPAYKENPAIGINKFRSVLHEKIRAMMVHLDTENFYECYETAVEVCNKKMCEKLYGCNCSPISRFYARQETAKILKKIETDEPEKIEHLGKICSEYRKLKAKLKTNTASIEKPYNWFTFVLHNIFLLLTFPVFVVGALLNIIPFVLPGFIRQKIGVKYNGFFSSFHFVLGTLISFPLLYIIQTVLFAIFVCSTWWVVILFIIGQFVFGKLAFCWFKSAKKCVLKTRLLFANKKLKTKIYELYNEINALVV